MTNSISQTKMINFKQRDKEEAKGKKSLRLRELAEQEELQQVKDYISSRRSCKEDQEEV